MEVKTEEKKSLALLAEEKSTIERILEESGGEITPEIEEALNQLDLQTADKIDGYYAFIERCNSVGDLMNARAEELDKIATAHYTLAKRLKDGIQYAMSTMGVSEIKGNIKRAKLQPTKGRLVVDEKLLPPEYMLQVVSQVPDKERIREKLELFEEIPGAKIEGGQSVRFYNVTAGK